MKKFTLVLIVCSFFTSLSIFAQPCTPGAYTDAGIYPDSIPGIPTAYVNTLYNTVITVVVPTDTIMFGSPLTIDSIGVVSVTGLPAGFTYNTNPVNGYISGGTSGCVSLTGTATSGQIGSYPLTITLESWVNAIPQGFIDVKQGYYTLVIAEIVGNNEINIEQPESIIYPNPFNKVTNINFSSPTDEEAIIYIFNNIGQLVYTENINAYKGNNNHIMKLNLIGGHYYYSIIGNNIKLSGKMSIED